MTGSSDFPTAARLERLHLGCGNEILPGWINHDLVALPGVDVVHDLQEYPWPFEDGRFDEIRMHHVLEHLEDPVRVIEELHRILRPGGTLRVRVPYWNSPDWATDPTHRTPFNEYSFDYFDPATYQGRERPYYSVARFSIRSKIYWIKPAIVYLPVRRRSLQLLLSALARHIGGVIWVIEWELVAMPSATPRSTSI
jgi:SAM-dependent methyltransferase